MESSPLMKWSSRVRTDDQRGFALISAVLLAALYFALMEVLLIDSTRSLREANHFRARVIAAAAAENAIEMAARKLSPIQAGIYNGEDAQSILSGAVNPIPNGFDLKGDATTKGSMTAHATVLIRGHLDASNPGQPPVAHIDFSIHSQ